MLFKKKSTDPLAIELRRTQVIPAKLLDSLENLAFVNQLGLLLELSLWSGLKPDAVAGVMKIAYADANFDAMSTLNVFNLIQYFPQTVARKGYFPLGVTQSKLYLAGTKPIDAETLAQLKLDEGVSAEVIRVAPSIVQNLVDGWHDEFAGEDVEEPESQEPVAMYLRNFILAQTCRTGHVVFEKGFGSNFKLDVVGDKSGTQREEFDAETSRAALFVICATHPRLAEEGFDPEMRVEAGHIHFVLEGTLSKTLFGGERLSLRLVERTEVARDEQSN